MNSEEKLNKNPMELGDNDLNDVSGGLNYPIPFIEMTVIYKCDKCGDEKNIGVSQSESWNGKIHETCGGTYRLK